jgi:hypothetical protein
MIGWNCIASLFSITERKLVRAATQDNFTSSSSDLSPLSNIVYSSV